MKKFLSLILTLLILVSVIPCGTAYAVEYLSIVSRDDGTWLWPLYEDAYYTRCSDWAGCNSSGKSGACPFHGYHCYDCSADHTTEDGCGHNGMDVGVPYSTPVFAMADGILYCTDYNHDSRGYTLVMEHRINNDWSYYSYYQHLSGVDVNLNGKAVRAGDVIAYTGNSAGNGTSGDAHLHFGIVMGPAIMGQAMANNPNDKDSGLSSLEKLGWIKEPGLASGRILNNPADNIPYVSGSSDSLMAHPGSVHYTFDKSKVSVGSYLSLCQFYPTYMTVTAKNIKKDSYIWTLPCISQTDARSSTIRAPKKNETYTVTAVCKNSVNHYWYQIEIDGGVGYIFPTVVETGDSLFDDVTITDVSTPSTLSVGSRFSLCGLIKTRFNKMKTLNAEIVRTSDNQKMCVWSKEINSNTYDILNSELDMAMLFNELPAGDYKLTIWADITNYYSVKGNDLKSGGACVYLVDSWFTVK